MHRCDVKLDGDVYSALHRLPDKTYWNNASPCVCCAYQFGFQAGLRQASAAGKVEREVELQKQIKELTTQLEWFSRNDKRG